MEELSKIAKGYYQASSDEIRKLVEDFFGAMDHDGDGKVDQREFMEFMRGEGYAQMTNPSFFNQLDLDKNGTLDFFEVITVYYIVKSGRPFCNNCNKFIASTYLKCIGCLEDRPGRSFYLCVDCYFTQKYNHTHNDLCRFLDNYSLLEAMNESKSNELRPMEANSRPTETNSIQGNPPMISNNHTSNPSSAMVLYRQPSNHSNDHLSSQGGPSSPGGPATSTTYIQNNYNSYYYPQVVAPYAIVPLPQRQNWKDAFGALNGALQAAVVGSYLCSIL